MAWFGKGKDDKETAGVSSNDPLYAEVKKIREQLVFLERKVDRLLGLGGHGSNRGGERHGQGGGERREQGGGHFRSRNRRFRMFKRPTADESAETDRAI